MTPPPDFHLGKHRITWTRKPNGDAVQFVAWTFVDGVTYVRAQCLPSRTNVLMFVDLPLATTTEVDLDALIAEWAEQIATTPDARAPRP